MVKIIVLLLVLGAGLVGLRASRFPRPPRRKQGDHSPYVGVLVVVGVTFVLLFALFVLPGLMNRLP